MARAFGAEGDSAAERSRNLVAHGPTLVVQVAQPRPAAGEAPETQVEALIDTGSSSSCIDVDTAAVIALPVVDVRTIRTAGGAQELPVYLASIESRDPPIVLYGQFLGVHLVSGGQRHAVLLGRDFLQSFRMTYEGGEGVFRLAHVEAGAGT